MTQDDSHLWDAYRTTQFLADTPRGEICIRIDEVQRELDLLLEDHAVNDWAFITAYNPASELLERSENDSRHLQFVRRIADSAHLSFSGRGVGEDPGWEPEESLLILGICREEAIQLGRSLGQNAIVCGSTGSSAELIVCESGQAYRP